MKIKTSKGNQKYLFMAEKTKDEIFITEKVINDLCEEMKAYLCMKHKQTFFRNMSLHYGMCWHCKDELNPIDQILIEDIDGKRPIKIYPLQNYHESDIIVIQKYFESLENSESENMKAEFVKPIEDGKYNGVISNVQNSLESNPNAKFDYTEFVITFDIEERKVELNFGCPSKVMYDEKTKKPTSKLATTFEDFGFKVPKTEFGIPEIKKHFLGIKVSSLIKTEKSKTSDAIFPKVLTMTPRL
jgi:hypothetical protein